MPHGVQVAGQVAADDHTLQAAPRVHRAGRGARDGGRRARQDGRHGDRRAAGGRGLRLRVAGGGARAELPAGTGGGGGRWVCRVLARQRMWGGGRRCRGARRDSLAPCRTSDIPRPMFGTGLAAGGRRRTVSVCIACCQACMRPCDAQARWCGSGGVPGSCCMHCARLGAGAASGMAGRSSGVGPRISRPGIGGRSAAAGPALPATSSQECCLRCQQLLHVQEAVLPV